MVFSAEYIYYFAVDQNYTYTCASFPGSSVDSDVRCNFPSIDPANEFCLQDPACLGVTCSKPSMHATSVKLCYPTKVAFNYLKTPVYSSVFLKNVKVVDPTNQTLLAVAEVPGEYTCPTVGSLSEQFCVLASVSGATNFCNANPACRGFICNITGCVATRKDFIQAKEDALVAGPGSTQPFGPASPGAVIQPSPAVSVQGSSTDTTMIIILCVSVGVLLILVPLLYYYCYYLPKKNTAKSVVGKSSGSQGNISILSPGFTYANNSISDKIQNRGFEDEYDYTFTNRTYGGAGHYDISNLYSSK